MDKLKEGLKLKIVTNEQMKMLDQRTIEEYDIPGLLLMEHASLALAQEVLSVNRENQVNGFVVCCGPGNNGGDGLALARHLLRNNLKTDVFLVSDPENLKGESRQNYQMLARQTTDIFHLSDREEKNVQVYMQMFEERLKEGTVVIDAIFGTGLDRDVEGLFLKVIERINQSPCTVVSVDIPSGVQGNTGKILANAVKADKTISFQLPKIGNLLYPGAALNGELIVVDIGIPAALRDGTDFAARKTDSESVRKWIRPCEKNDHKGHGGTILILAGSRGMTGASVLAAKAALRSGAGLVRIACEEKLNDLYEQMLPEATTISYPIDENGHLTHDAEEILKSQMTGADVIVAGPGWGKSKGREAYLSFLLQTSNKPMVLDADALNILSEHPEWFTQSMSPWIMTPHPGEMARLTGLTVEEINQNRLKVTKTFAEKWKATILLKGAGTVIADENGEVWINSTGNPGMATGGSGDVLAGMIAALCHRTDSGLKAAAAAAYLHGFSGDIAAEFMGMTGIIAGDLIEFLPAAIKKVIE